MRQYDFTFETKEVSDAGEIEGYASTFGNVDQGGDAVQPGAFIESIVQAKRDRRVIPMLWAHDMNKPPIGSWVDIAEDQKGLFVKGELDIDDDPEARRIHGKLKRGSVRGLSIGYRIPLGGAEPDEKRRGVTRLVKIDLREISLVTMAMNLEARVARVKSIVEAGDLPSLSEFEAFLREEGGFSRSRAAAIASHGLKYLLNQREAGQSDDEAAAFLRALLPA